MTDAASSAPSTSGETGVWTRPGAAPAGVGGATLSGVAGEPGVGWAMSSLCPVRRLWGRPWYTRTGGLPGPGG